MKIHDREGAPHPARIRIVLAAKGLDDQVEFVPVDLIAAERGAAAILASSSCVSGIFPPAATTSCHSTRSWPVIASVTGCST